MGASRGCAPPKRLTTDSANEKLMNTRTLLSEDEDTGRVMTGLAATVACLALCVLVPLHAAARTINVNLYNSNGTAADHQIQSADSAGAVPVAAQHWSQIGFPAGSLSGGSPQRSVALTDDAGNAAASFVSTLETAYVSNSGAAVAAPDSGNGRLMASYLAYDDPADGESPDDTGHLRIENLSSTFTTAGYRVYVYFDTDGGDRTHTITVTPDGGSAQQVVGEDSGTFSGDLVAAVGSGAYANVAVFTNLTASGFTLAMDSNTGRAAVNGIQVVNAEQPLPPEILSFTTDDIYLAPGESAMLSWAVEGETNYFAISPAPGDVTASTTDGTGTVSVTPTQTTLYTLTVSNAVGVASQSVRIGVGPARPNILFFLVDDMGWQDTSLPFHYDANGDPVVSALNQRYRTPHMETLAGRGMMFTSAYACSVCSPTRVSIMTGMNSARHYVTTWTHPDSPRDTGSNQVPHLKSPDWRTAGMDETDVTLPSLLQQAGYRTIHAGKAHFGCNGSFAGDPRAIGFDVNIAGHGAGGPGSYYGTQNFGSGTWQVPGLEEYHGEDIFLTEALTREMNASIEQSVQDGVPFFAYMAHYAVHVPWASDSRFATNYPSLSGGALEFATLVEGMDRSLGDILAKLEELGVAEDTFVIFLSDNGGDYVNTPLQSKKGTGFEGGGRVPLTASWAKRNPANAFQTALPVPAASRVDDIVAAWDMFPTVLGTAGVTLPSGTMDGHDLRPYFRDDPGTHRPQEFVMHFPHGHNNDHFSIMRSGEWKLIYNYGDESYELYNLVDDIGEATNLESAEPVRLYDMAEALVDRLDGMAAQYPVDVDTGLAVKPVLPPAPMNVYLMGGQSNMRTEIKTAFVDEMLNIDCNRSIYAAFYSNSGKPLDSGWNDQSWEGDPPAPGRVTFYPGTSDTDPNIGTVYSAMIADWQAELAALTEPYTIKGIIWVQGEQDTKNTTSANRYAADLDLLVNRVHEEFSLTAGSVPFYYSRLLSTAAHFTYADDLRQQQDNADQASGHADSITNAYIVDSSSLTFSDGVHYDVASMPLLGQRFAAATAVGWPSVTADGGATNVTASMADLSGYLVSTGGAPTEVYAFWGPTDGFRVAADWSHTKQLDADGMGPLTCAVSGLAENTRYYYRFCAMNAFGVSWARASESFTTCGAIPFTDDFESRLLGDLDGQYGWTASGASVQTNAVVEGVQAVGIEGGASEVSHLFEEGSTQVWTDLRCLPVFGAPASDPPDGSTFAFYFNTNGLIMAFDGSTPSQLDGVVLQPNEWARFTVHSDHVNANWDLWVNGVSVVTDLEFFSPRPGSYSGLILNGCADGTTYIDNVNIGLRNPLDMAAALFYGR